MNNSRVTHVFEQSLKLKYSYLILFGQFFCLLAVALPSLYLIEQNYALFEKLSYAPSPAILTQLETEMSWLYWYFGLVSVAILSLSFVLAVRVSGHIVEPMLRLESHIQAISRGRYNELPLASYRGDEFQSLIVRYNQFCKSLQMDIAEDLKVLESLAAQCQSDTAQAIIDPMIAKKNVQLGKTTYQENDVLVRSYPDASLDQAGA